MRIYIQTYTHIYQYIYIYMDTNKDTRHRQRRRHKYRHLPFPAQKHCDLSFAPPMTLGAFPQCPHPCSRAISTYGFARLLRMTCKIHPSMSLFTLCTFSNFAMSPVSMLVFSRDAYISSDIGYIYMYI